LVLPIAVITAAGSSLRIASARFIAGSMCPAVPPPATTILSPPCAA
jgi:hypothetical protein